VKIGILTLSLRANYGGNLQAFALMTVLRDLGHDPYLINRERHKVAPIKVPLVVLYRAAKKYLLCRNVSIRSGTLDHREIATLTRYAREFINKHVQPQTKEFLSSRALSRDIGRYRFDAIIVGSDQVWRRNYIAKCFTDFFLGFLPNDDVRTRRIAYAASFGTSDWLFTPEETRRCANLAQRFHAIGVREDSGIGLCKQYLGVDAEHVIDPTLLLEPSRYTRLIPDVKETRSGVLVYVLDNSNEKQHLVRHVSECLGLPIFEVNAHAPGEPAPPVEDWLRGFRDADFVVTDSFHGTVFSILFEKPFIAVGNAQRGMTRFEALLRMFGLENRLVAAGAVVDSETIRTSPDWRHINAVLASERAKAMAFLRGALDPIHATER